MKYENAYDIIIVTLALFTFSMVGSASTCNRDVSGKLYESIF